MLKFIPFCFFLGSAYLIPPAYSLDLGVQGSVFRIEEEDLLEYILAKTNDISLPNQEEIIKAQIESFKKPQRVEIGEACEDRVYFYDPKVKVQADITDHEGNIVVKKGTTFNPLGTVSLNQEMIFFDATNKEHLEWAKQSPKAKWILVNGNPIELEKELNRPIYFDQFGVITKKLKIQNVPAKVSQEGLKLKIEEIFLRGSDEK